MQCHLIPQVQGRQRPFIACGATPDRRVHAPQHAMTPAGTGGSGSNTRRQLLQYTGLLSMGIAAAPDMAMAAGKIPKGFAILKDTNDGYTFLYPFGWQELTVDGQDVVLKDVIEPLESVSVNLIDTPRETVAEFGDIGEVAFTLADKVLTGPKQQVKIVSTNERADENGRKYYEFEFTVDTGRYQRHSLAVVTVGNGKFYTLTTGANERRWDKMKDKLSTVVRSFEVFPRFNS